MEVRVELLLLTLPIPLVNLGERNANLICKLLDQIVRPVSIFLVTDLKHGLLLLIESDARLLDLGLSTLLGHGILTNREWSWQGVLLTEREKFHIFVAVAEKSSGATALSQLINELIW